MARFTARRWKALRSTDRWLKRKLQMTFRARERMALRSVRVGVPAEFPVIRKSVLAWR